MVLTTKLIMAEETPPATLVKLPPTEWMKLGAGLLFHLILVVSLIVRMEAKIGYNTENIVENKLAVATVESKIELMRAENGKTFMEIAEKLGRLDERVRAGGK